MRAEVRPRALASRLALLLLVGLVAGCTDSSGLEPSTEAGGATSPGVRVSSYVALGDSYTSAPFVPTTDLADGCFRSDGNYPSLVADELDPQRFADVSCSAAETEDVTRPQATAGGRGRVAPQLRAVEESADLVTLGIGANDEGLFASLVSRCTVEGSADLCTDALVSGSREVLARTRARLVRVLEAVARRAPDALVVLVGYPRLVAPQQPCPDIPVPTGLLDDVAGVESRLNRTLRSAADSAGAAYVDMYEASRGHEICSPDPWVNGRRTDEQRALAYHPFAVGQTAVAAKVLDVVRAEAGR
jgi:lysophospholipase L1-like esterase